MTDQQVDGVFCCQGCLQVHQLLEDLDSDEAQQVREETIRRRQQERSAKQPPENCGTAFLKVNGMHCATCESFIEAISRRQEGIYKSEASYATEMVKVYYDTEKLEEKELPALISRMGYRASNMEQDRDGEELNTVARLVIGGFFSIIGLLLYILFLYPSYLGGEGLVPLTTPEKLYFVSNIFVMTSFVLVYTGFPILRGALVSISVMKPNMDLLIAIAAVSAYLYSTGALLTGSSEVYFDVTMAIVMVVSIGNYYEGNIKRSKNRMLSVLMDRKISTARVRRNGRLELVDLEDLRPGDHVVINAGERVPVDGTVIEGEGVVNEALLTGESLPVSKQPGDRVISGTILTQHALTIETGEVVQSTLDHMIQLMWEIQANRSGKRRLADRIAEWFVPGVLAVGALTFFYHLGSGNTPTDALLTALAVLIVSCPCALGLATPLAVASGIREALGNNIIFKSGAIFEQEGNIDILAMDKTGTLTTGRMHLLDPGTDRKALHYARSLEQFSSHPLAKALVNGSSEERDLPGVQDFRSHHTGVSGTIDSRRVWVGEPEWLEQQSFDISASQWNSITHSREYGHVPVGVAWDGSVRDVLVIGDQVRDEAEAFAQKLRTNGKQLALITGDSEAAARTLQDRLQPDFLFTGARPESKTEIIRKLKQIGAVAMVGDGSNDALALAEADLGIAFGDLTAIAAESAQVVVPDDNLERIFAALETIRQTRRRIRQNLGWAFLYNITTIPLAIAGLINPLFAALAMAASSLLVVSNSSRNMNLTL
ncbi:MAG: cation-translocating P-type ATPase [Balneolaceae bacterium]|nr:cation-translocating P-type ATPase [Balneolaceae bacterium]